MRHTQSVVVGLVLGLVARLAPAQAPVPAPAPAPAENAVATAERDKYLEKLIHALTRDDNYKVRLQAAVLLGRSGDARAIDPLVTALGADEHFTVRAASATALANLGEAKAIAHIIKRMAVDNDAFVRDEAARALDKYDRATALPYVVAVYNGSDDERVRRIVIEYVADDVDVAAEPVLERALGDSDAILTVARGAVLGMEKTRALEFLRRAVTHREPSVRKGAVQLLRAVKTAEAAQAILGVFEKDVEVEDVREEARRSLRELREFMPVAPLVQDAQSGGTRAVRVRALKLLGVLGGSEAEKVLVQALDDRDDYVRGNAVISMQFLGSQAVVPALEKLANDPARNERILPLVRTTLRQLREKSGVAVPAK